MRTVEPLSKGHSGKIQMVCPLYRGKRFQSHYIDRGDKIVNLVCPLWRGIIQRPFPGGSSLRGSTVIAFVLN